MKDEAYGAERIGQLLRKLEEATEEFKALDIFESINIELDRATSGKLDETDVTITVKEKGWRSLHVGATTDGSDEAGESSLTLLNAIGEAEKISLSATYARSGSNTQRATFKKPRFLGLPLFLNAIATNELHNQEWLSSYNEKIRAGSISISDYEGVHDLSLNVGWRDLLPRRDSKIPTAYRASPSILSEAMPSTKTSVKYVFTDDNRNNMVYPTAGGLFKYTTEIAGLVGDVKFVKAEVEGQKHVAVGPVLFGFPILNFSLSYHVGTVKSYGSEQHRPARISDRFFLGGPMNVRGFNHKGIGPRASPLDGGVAQGDALGGDVSYNGTASVGFPVPLPLFAALGLRGQLFANAGNLTTWDRILDEKKWMKNLADDTRVSVGMGLVWGTRIGRLEANYSWILKAHDHGEEDKSQAQAFVLELLIYAMYSGNAARIYNPQPDPLERGPPKRVLREEQHIGEMVAASKKRVTWRFTLGESDRTHEVVLVHSVMSYKKVVQYDGRQMHFSATATMGDWNFTMILDGLNVVMEVRINDMESVEVPKYDFVIDRIPFRRWDVYRRKKHAITAATYAQPNAPSGNAFGTHRWGPGGATAPSQNDHQTSRGSFTGSNRDSFTGSSRGSFTGNSPTPDRTQSFNHQGSRSRSSSGHSSSGRTRSFSGQQTGQQGFGVSQQHAGQRSSLQEQSVSAPSNATAKNVHHAPPPAPAAPKPKKQAEINLLDDFGPSVSVSAQALIFDPLASGKISAAGELAATNSSQQQQPRQQAPPVAAVPQQAPYVDPFASVAAPVMAKPAGNINLDPFASHNTTYQQHSQQQQQQPIHQMPVGQAAGYQMQQPMGMQMGGMAMQQQGMRGSFTGQQQPVAPSGMGNVNYNISQLMNPASLQTGQQNQQGKSINIDAFASLQ
ncbi:SAM50-like protein SPAC17C9.06 [Phytophthora citrophthora]|uniref:SAM50-like protein SPAC17C9.06 n=1 Tax=Phytophthora citrophthora TaxID=4793 RepID=A0AAD9H0F2_9STRA|nr:SAM50-like protein SPAC17C9.06 [Phytophthora citrophthora]